jgi:hypothetical protein
VDNDRTGLIAPEDWAAGLRTVLQLELPFLSLLPRLAETDPVSGLVSYPRFLDRYRIEMVSPDGSSGAWQEAVIDAICERLFVALQRLEGDKGRDAHTPRSPTTTSVKDAFSLFDADQDGRIEYEEFTSLLKTMDVGLSEAQIYELMRGMDKNKDSVIDLEEFTSRFGIIFTGYVDRENVRACVPVCLPACLRACLPACVLVVGVGWTGAKEVNECKLQAGMCVWGNHIICPPATYVV